MLGSQTDPEKPSNTKCQIAEIVQYACPIEPDESGQLRYICYPVLRIFRICPGRPAVEITKLVNVDTRTGEVDVSSQSLPKAKHWRDVIRIERQTTD